MSITFWRFFCRFLGEEKPQSKTRLNNDFKSTPETQRRQNNAIIQIVFYMYYLEQVSEHSQEHSHTLTYLAENETQLPTSICHVD